MTQVRTNGPRISPVWLAGLLAGEAHCEWASWFRARHEDWGRHPIPDLSDPPGSDEYFDMLKRGEWAATDRDREHEARTRAEARIKELEEEIRRLSSL